LTPSEQQEVVRLYQEATMSTADIRERFGIGDSSLYRLLQKHGVALRGRAASASGSTAAPSPTPASRHQRAASPRPVRSPVAGTTTSVTAPASATPRNNGATHAFSVSFRAVRVVEAMSVLDAVREVERLGATDIEEISRQ
jgi:transposase-like protein